MLPLAWTTPWASWRLEPSHLSLSGHTDWVRAMAFGQVEGRPVVISGSDDRTVRAWDAATGIPIRDPFIIGYTGYVTAVAFGQVEGRPVVISGSDDGTMRGWNAATGTPIGDFTGHTNYVTAVAFGQVEGRPVVISGSDDRTVRVWDAATGTPIGHPLTGHTDAVTAVAFGQVEGRPVVISGSDDRTVRVWDATCERLDDPVPPQRNGRHFSIHLAAAVLAVAIDDDGLAAIGAELGIVCLRLPR